MANENDLGSMTPTDLGSVAARPLAGTGSNNADLRPMTSEKQPSVPSSDPIVPYSESKQEVQLTDEQKAEQKTFYEKLDKAKKAVDMDALLVQAPKGTYEGVKEKLEGMNEEERNKALRNAAEKDLTAYFKMLLAAGANPDAKGHDADGKESPNANEILAGKPDDNTKATEMRMSVAQSKAAKEAGSLLGAMDGDKDGLVVQTDGKGLIGNQNFGTGVKNEFAEGLKKLGNGDEQKGREILKTKLDLNGDGKIEDSELEASLAQSSLDTGKISMQASVAGLRGLLENSSISGAAFAQNPEAPRTPGQSANNVRTL